MAVQDDTGDEQDASHPRTDTDTSDQQDPSHPRTDTDTSDQQDPSHPRTDTTDQPSNNVGGVTDLQRSCEKEGRPWVDTQSGGYCGTFGKIQGTQESNPPSEQNVSQEAAEAYLLKILNHTLSLAKSGVQHDIPQWLVNVCFVSPTPLDCMKQNYPSLFQGQQAQTG